MGKEIIFSNSGMFVKPIPWQKEKKNENEMSFELCKKLLSSYVVAPIVKLLCKRLQPRQLHLFFFNLEDNKIVITYPFQRCRGKGRYNLC